MSLLLAGAVPSKLMETSQALRDDFRHPILRQKNCPQFTDR
jgi:hypothetical protein